MCNGFPCRCCRPVLARVDEFNEAKPWKCYYAFAYGQGNAIVRRAITHWQQSGGKLRYNNAVGIPINQDDGQDQFFQMWMKQPPQFGNQATLIRYSYEFGYEMPGQPFEQEIDENEFGNHPAYINVAKRVRVQAASFYLDLNNFPSLWLDYDHPVYGLIADRWSMGLADWNNTSDFPKTGTVKVIRELRQTDNSHRIQVRIDGSVRTLYKYLNGQVSESGDWTSWMSSTDLTDSRWNKYETAFECAYSVDPPAGQTVPVTGEAFATRLEVSTEVD